MPQRGFLIFVVICVAMLAGLGTWQLQRLSEKRALIARMEHGLSLPPRPLVQALSLQAGGDDVSWTRVQAQGRYLAPFERRLYGLRNGVAGWRLLTPLLLADGRAVYIDRGFVAKGTEGRFPPPGGERRLFGVIHLYPEERPFFAADNDPDRNIWYWRDFAALAQGLPSAAGEARAALLPFIIHETPDGEADVPGPALDPVTVKLPNNHLGYALTWYTLAVLVAALAVVVIYSRRHRREELPRSE